MDRLLLVPMRERLRTRSKAIDGIVGLFSEPTRVPCPPPCLCAHGHASHRTPGGAAYAAVRRPKATSAADPHDAQRRLLLVANMLTVLQIARLRSEPCHAMPCDSNRRARRAAMPYRRLQRWRAITWESAARVRKHRAFAGMTPLSRRRASGVGCACAGVGAARSPFFLGCGRGTWRFISCNSAASVSRSLSTCQAPRMRQRASKNLPTVNMLQHVATCWNMLRHVAAPHL